jgi:hypothetical protein
MRRRLKHQTAYVADTEPGYQRNVNSLLMPLFFYNKAHITPSSHIYIKNRATEEIKISFGENLVSAKNSVYKISPCYCWYVYDKKIQLVRVYAISFFLKNEIHQISNQQFAEHKLNLYVVCKSSNTIISICNKQGYIKAVVLLQFCRHQPFGRAPKGRGFKFQY